MPGFSESTIRFLAELSRNNDRAWFEAHVEDFERVVMQFGTPGFVDFAFMHFSRMAPLHAWLVALRG